MQFLTTFAILLKSIWIEFCLALILLMDSFWIMILILTDITLRAHAMQHYKASFSLPCFEAQRCPRLLHRDNDAHQHMYIFKCVHEWFIITKNLGNQAPIECFLIWLVKKQAPPTNRQTNKNLVRWLDKSLVIIFKMTNQIFYCQFTQKATSWGFQLERVLTLDTSLYCVTKTHSVQLNSCQNHSGEKQKLVHQEKSPVLFLVLLLMWKWPLSSISGAFKGVIPSPCICLFLLWSQLKGSWLVRQ